MTAPQSQQTRELTKTEYELLTGLETEMYSNSNNFPNIEKSELLKAARSLRERGLIKHGKGLWTEDGEMFGSGWCLVYEKQDEISELVNSYEKNSVKKYSESDFAQARQQWVKEESLDSWKVKECLKIANGHYGSGGTLRVEGVWSVLHSEVKFDVQEMLKPLTEKQRLEGK